MKLQNQSWPEQMFREAEELSRKLTQERTEKLTQVYEESEADFIKGIRDLKKKFGFCPVGV